MIVPTISMKPGVLAEFCLAELGRLGHLTESGLSASCLNWIKQRIAMNTEAAEKGGGKPC